MFYRKNLPAKVPKVRTRWCPTCRNEVRVVTMRNLMTKGRDAYEIQMHRGAKSLNCEGSGTIVDTQSKPLADGLILAKRMR